MQENFQQLRVINIFKCPQITKSYYMLYFHSVQFSKPHTSQQPCIHESSAKHITPSEQLSKQNIVLPTDLKQTVEVCWSLTHSKKFVMSRLLQLDHATSIASASKLGVITCRVLPSRRLQPIFSVSWYMPKLKEGYLEPVVDILPPCQNEFKVFIFFLAPLLWLENDSYGCQENFCSNR